MNILLHKALRDLRAAFAQTAALVTIVALGIASYIALLGAYRDLSTSYNSTYDRLRFADAEFALQAAPANATAGIARLPGVAAATGRLILDTGFQLPDGEQIRARLIGLPPGDHPAVDDVLVTEGRFLPGGDPHTALVEQHFAAIYGLHPGDSVSPIVAGQKVDFAVAGVVASPEYLVVTPSRQDILPSPSSFAVLFVPLATLQGLAATPQGASDDYINNIVVRYTAAADAQQAQQSVEAALAPYGVLSVTPRAAQPSNEALSLDLAGYHELAVLLPGLILLVSALALYAMLGRTVRAQQPQIGLLKALGYGDAAVMTHYLTFGLLIALIGAAVGIAGGLLLGNLVTTEYAAELGIPLVVSRFYPDAVATGVGLSLLFALLACVSPARAAVRMAPAQAMSMDPAAALLTGRISWLERISGGLHPSIWLRLPLRNVFRVRSRSLSTGLGIVMAFILVLVSWGLIDSMSYLLNHNFKDVERWDVYAVFSAPQQQATLDLVSGWTGVRQVEPLVQLPASLQANGHSADAFLTAFDPSQQLHRLQLSASAAPAPTAALALAGRQIVLTPDLADKLGLTPGADLKVQTQLGAADLTLSAISAELSGSSAFVSTDTVTSLAGTAPGSGAFFNGLYLTVDPGQEQAIKAALYHLPGAASVRFKSDVQNDWNSLLGLYYAFLGAAMAFAVAMAFALLFNAMTVNVLERRREFATMRAIGMSGGAITRQATVENVIMWLVVLLPGLVLGTWAANQMGAAFSSDLLQFKIVIAPPSYLFSALGILLTMELATLPALRRISKLNLAEATKTLA